MSTPELKELEGLLALVREADGKSVGIDSAIWYALKREGDIDYYTSSLDACLSLMGVLPEDATYGLGNGWLHDDGKQGPGAVIHPHGGGTHFVACAKTEPLALLDCILQALIAKEAANVV